MRLKSIKLAGFKSFVDPTTVQLPSNMCGVVGPNGCGKSNIIDAVRWVMGESSAKNLRGESMADVIFNGSGNRQPVGQASIELVFDNSDGGIGGEYAGYSEISVRRLVSREGQSEYFLNGTRCRRRDITDIFLGTGLGPRSYAIIEQGMISRLIESRPEELRIFIEEAAGISKYKERRRETESRMRRTLENLERLTDLREELERQLQHLQRQAQAAERFRSLRDEERALRQRLLAAQCRELDQQGAEGDTRLRELDLRSEALRSEHTALESSLETQRETQSNCSDAVTEAQGQVYSVGSEVSRIEQEIRYRGERDKQIEEELETTRSGLAQAQRHLDEDGAKLTGWEQELAELGPELSSLQAVSEETSGSLTGAEQAMQAWQQDWEEFNQQAAGPRQQAEVQQSRLQHLEHSLTRLQRRLDQLLGERQSADAAGEEEELERWRKGQLEAAELLRAARARAEDLEGQVARLQEERAEHQGHLDEQRAELQILRGRHASLEALQNAARERAGGTAAEDWLKARALHEKPRLLELLHVEPRWQGAVETVLGNLLQGVCVEQLQGLDEALMDISSGELALLGPASALSLPATSLAQQVRGDHAQALLGGVHCAESPQEARRMLASLPAGDSVITPEGLWYGANWVRRLCPDDAESGLLQRQEALEALGDRIQRCEASAAERDSALQSCRERLSAQEQAWRAARTEAERASQAHGEQLAGLRAAEARQEQLLANRRRMEQERTELQAQYEQEQSTIGEARATLAQAIERMDADAQQRSDMLARRDTLREALDAVRARAHQARDRAHQAALRHQSLLTQSETIRDALRRARDQVKTLGERDTQLQRAASENAEPLQGLRRDLEGLLGRRAAAEETLTAARQAMSEADAQLRATDQERLRIEQRAEQLRSELESARLARQGLQLRRDSLLEQLTEQGGELEALLETLPEEVDMAAWEGELERIKNRIQRLGAINLAAVDEYRQQAERKQYLDAQNEDLEAALGTLEAAIRKIDRETRSRFRETFDQVNSGLKALFPRVFGGGSASLEMTGDDLLDTGISILARPPGKKNSTIHLLSGGEKALTAIALVFSIFQLNPAPFCMLDEVDAPLDDANVGRYARMVKEMSEKVQFVFITHNKITMEMADHLMGVTMHEPGVSRLVSVDVAEAAELAAS